MPHPSHRPLLLAALCGGLLCHYGPALWVACKRRVGRKLFPQINS